MRNRFDLQLKQLNDDIIEMGNMIERAIEMGVYALIGHDTDKAKQTIDYDMDFDHMDKINQLASESFDGQIESHTMLFYGICGDCLRKS